MGALLASDTEAGLGRSVGGLDAEAAMATVDNAPTTITSTTTDAKVTQIVLFISAFLK